MTAPLMPWPADRARQRTGCRGLNASAEDIPPVDAPLPSAKDSSPVRDQAWCIVAVREMSVKIRDRERHGDQTGRPRPQRRRSRNDTHRSGPRREP